VLVSVVIRHGDISEDLKKYAEEKARKLVKFYDRIQAIEILFQGEKENRSVEIIVSAEPNRLTFVAHETSADLAACVDLALDKIGRQLKRHKEKQRNHKGLEKAPEVQPTASEEESEES
jgi:putative sigma-54 modulation protein